ncbi:hypothetical protein B0H66DRAFT_528870 [Apodospora peruviana]|uniref:Uncharacterized protein n=1 Tax=Apodospora peruviana TaxID=516989 RepID=A0AAE0MGN5_9PEZI|nr:hypothetical protein B0H66DRAFT_528870 [Apodospora peruviana]
MYRLSSQSTSLLVPKPREASTEHPQHADPDQNGTVLLYDHSSDKVLDANYQGESGLRSDQTVAQPVQNQLVQNQLAGTGIAIMNGDLSIGSQETVISQGASVPRFTPANGSSTIQVSRPEEATSEPQSRLDQDTRKKRHGSPPGRASKKRPRRRGNGTSQDGRTDFHPGDPLQIVPSPPPTQPQSRPNDQVYTLNHNNIASVGTDDRAEGTDLQETRMFTPINAGRDGGPATSLPDNISAASSSPRREVMGLIPSFQPSVRVHPPSSGATESFKDKRRRPEPTGCRPGPDEPAGADWHADQSPGVTPLCTPAQSQVIVSPESPAPMGEVVGNRFQADSHPALVRTSDGGSSQAEDVGEQPVTNSAALGDTQPPSIPTKARSGYGQARKTQSDDDHSDGQPNEDQFGQSSEGQFDDQTVEKAAPTRPRKRQRRDESRGPPHLLPTPPASQSQTQPNRSTRTALHQPVPPSTHTVTDRSPDIQFTAKGPRDRSPLGRERRGDNGAGLHPGDPVYVSSPPAPQTKGIIAGLVLPDLCGAVEEQLAALISFGSGHYPPDDFVQFRPGEMITGRILYELLHLELKQFSNHALG